MRSLDRREVKPRRPMVLQPCFLWDQRVEPLSRLGQSGTKCVEQAFQMREGACHGGPRVPDPETVPDPVQEYERRLANRFDWPSVCAPGDTHLGRRRGPARQHVSSVGSVLGATRTAGCGAGERTRIGKPRPPPLPALSALTGRRFAIRRGSGGVVAYAGLPGTREECRSDDVGCECAGAIR